MTQDMFIDALGCIDQDLLDQYALDEIRFTARKRRRMPVWGKLLIAAACLMLVFSITVGSLPVMYVFNKQEIDRFVSDTVDRVVFPLEGEQEGEIDREDLLVDWTSWPAAESFFNALGAGEENSVIDRLQSSESGLLSDLWKILGDFLEHLFEYYNEYSEEQPSTIGDHTKNKIVLEIEPDGDYCKVLKVVSYEKKSIRLPKKYEDLIIREIGDDAFAGLEDITSVTLDDSVEIIGNNAFLGCTSLTSVKMPGVIKIGTSAFEGCSDLETVDIPCASQIGTRAFANCSKLTYMDLTGTHRIGQQAFSGCEALTEIEYSEKLGTIDDYAFENCTSLTVFKIEKHVANLGKGVFSGCTSLRSVDLKSIDHIPDYMFDGCKSLQSITMYYALNRIGVCGLRNCKKLVSISGQWSIDSLGESAMEGCGLHYVHLETYQEKELPTKVFFNCPYLTNVQINASVKKICAYAFANCPELKEIHFAGTKGQWENIEIEPGAIPSGTRIVFDNGSILIP